MEYDLNRLTVRAVTGEFVLLSHIVAIRIEGDEVNGFELHVDTSNGRSYQVVHQRRSLEAGMHEEMARLLKRIGTVTAPHVRLGARDRNF